MSGTKNKNVPTVSDFSERSKNKAVLNKSLQHDATLWPGAVGLLGTLGAVLFDAAWIPVVAIAGLGVGSLSLAVNYFFRSNKFGDMYLNNLRKQVAEHKKKVIKELRKEIASYKSIPDLRLFSEQALEQFERIESKFETLQHMLSKKLIDGEITYSRFFGTAEQVYLAVLDNLSDVTHMLKVVKGVDPEYIDSRLDELNKLEALKPADEEEINTLNRRREVRKSQHDKINTLLTRNEEAMTQMDVTTAALTDMKTVRGQALVDIDTAKEQLDELAKHAKNYK
ncbi:hypothetical protein ACFL2A_01475 [Thermodesulfobacteriota bacterium]